MWQNILLSAVGVVVTGLVTWLTERLISLINSKIKNAKYAKCLTDAVEVVTGAVKTTYQTYVEALKDKNMFTSEAQIEALKKAKDITLSQLSVDVQKYINDNFGDVESWISNTVESTIYDLKNKKSGEEKSE